MRHARTGAVVLVIALAAGTAACGDDDADESVPTTDTAPTTTTGDTTTSTTEEPATELPPAGASDLEPIYGAALAELGLRLVDRGGLIDRGGGGYAPSATGTHLAIYVEPIDDRTIPEYIDGIRSVAAMFGDVFERWPGLATYDVCQEPVDPDGSLGPEPLPVTQIELTREEAQAFDWDSVTVVDLVRASLTEPRGLALRVSSTLASDPSYEAIVAEAS